VSRLTPDVVLEWNLPTAPEGTDAYSFAFKPLADQDSFKEPRLRSVSAIERRLSTDDGDSQAPTVTINIDDADGIIRAILANAVTRHAIGGEAALRLISETGRKAGLAANDLLRGRVTDLQAPPGRIATMKVSGDVGALFVGINMDKTIPNARIGAEHPNAPETSVGLVYPLIIGEHSDVDATDANGNSVEKGILPAIDCGDVLMLDDGTEVDPADGVITYLDEPTNLIANVNGTPGTRTVVYEVTALSLYGETTAASVTVSTAPDIFDGTDNVDLEWDADPSGETIAYRVYRNHKRIALLNNGGTYATPETTYVDLGVESVSPGPPSVNTAQISILVGSDEAFGWTRFVAAGKACHIEYLYGWNGADGVAPTRARIEASRIGWDKEVLLPGETDWPHATDYLDLERPDGTIIRQTCFYARGPLVAQHRNKSVTLAWNGWGVEDVGDLTGDPIIQFFPGLQWLVNEEGLKDDGAGYLTGNYGPLETFSNGVTKLKSSKFHNAQALSAKFLGDDIGYIMNLAITEPTTWRTVIRRAHQTVGSFDGTSRVGQWYPVLIDDVALSESLTEGLSPLQDEGTMSGNLGDETSSSAPPTGAYVLDAERRAYVDTINVIRWAGQTIRYDKALTKQLYDLSWDADAQRFRLTDQKVEYPFATYGHKEAKSKTKRQCYYTHDPATAGDATDRFVRRHLIPSREFSFAVDLMGMDDELGDEVTVTHYEGAAGASGDVLTRAVLIGHVANLDPDANEVVLTALDLSRVVVNSLSPLQNENEMDTGNLGDETSLEAPPVGAEILT
jgi:hypothetical protein